VSSQHGANRRSYGVTRHSQKEPCFRSSVGWGSLEATSSTYRPAQKLLVLMLHPQVCGGRFARSPAVRGNSHAAKPLPGKKYRSKANKISQRVAKLSGLSNDQGKWKGRSRSHREVGLGVLGQAGLHLGTQPASGAGLSPPLCPRGVSLDSSKLG